MRIRGKRIKIELKRFGISVSVICIALIGLIIMTFHSFHKQDNTAIATNNKVTIVNKVNSDNVTPKPKKSYIVCIDPGHGAYDKGTSSADGVFEKDVVLKVGLKVGEILEKRGVQVVYTRKDDKTILGKKEREDLTKRVQICHDSKADIFVAIHCNDYTDSSIKGLEVCCNFPKTRGEELAKDIDNKLSDLHYTTDRKIRYKATNPIYVLRKNDCPAAALVELGYLSNKGDCKYISSESGQTKCAEAIASAILNYGESIKK